MVLWPLTEHAPFDLVVYKARRFHRVQVRFRRCNASGCLAVHLRSIWNDKRGTHRLAMNKDEVDVVCVYCPATDACYYFDPNTVRQSITLRVKEPGNRQRIGVRMAEEYRKVPIGTLH
jgi:PD-(D/E)XK endonuclease